MAFNDLIFFSKLFPSGQYSQNWIPLSNLGCLTFYKRDGNIAPMFLHENVRLEWGWVGFLMGRFDVAISVSPKKVLSMGCYNWSTIGVIWWFLSKQFFLSTSALHHSFRKRQRERPNSSAWPHDPVKWSHDNPGVFASFSHFSSDNHNGTFPTEINNATSKRRQYCCTYLLYRKA